MLEMNFAARLFTKYNGLLIQRMKEKANMQITFMIDCQRLTSSTRMPSSRQNEPRTWMSCMITNMSLSAFIRTYLQTPKQDQDGQQEKALRIRPKANLLMDMALKIVAASMSFALEASYIEEAKSMMVIAKAIQKGIRRQASHV